MYKLNLQMHCFTCLITGNQVWDTMDRELYLRRVGGQTGEDWRSKEGLQVFAWKERAGRGANEWVRQPRGQIKGALELG